MADPAYEAARAAAAQLTARLGAHRVVVVLGSGWADVAGRLGDVNATLPMSDLPGFPPPRVEGHSGLAYSVDCGGVPVLVLAGRSHLYEGHPVEAVVHGVRAAVMSGCEAVLLSNAAGSLNAAHGPGQPVLIRDQLNLTHTNPMLGEGPPADLPARFVDLTHLYSPRLRDAARAAVPGIPEGVYAGLTGGPYETPAEIAMLRAMGADLVGMSTVLEAIAAKHLGAEVFGVSLVTNLAAGMSDDRLDHEDVLATGAASIPRLARLMASVIGALR
ncbi:MAG: purine-nucleoside phosphorylase [Thermoleophilia bacterium]|nr:purine-nucleoside phosphorylase [Thermoleophilia bacterium]